MARGLPGAPGLAVPLYPDTNAEPPFTKTSAMVYFTAPAKDGLLVDRWRVEWATEATFSVLTTQVPLLTPLSLPSLSPLSPLSLSLNHPPSASSPPRSHTKPSPFLIDLSNLFL